jgi:nonsense-mediated mRNA decay protein 3
MTIQEGFCPRCGGPSREGLCPKCRVEETSWLLCDPRISFVQCPTCGSLKSGNTWTDSPQQDEALAVELALGAVHLHEDVRDVNIEVAASEPSPNRTVCQVHVTGTLYGLPVGDTCRVEIAWKKEQCDRCSRYSGGYYEGVLQLRAAGRKPDAFERERMTAIASTIEEELQQQGERLSFISKTEETKDGIDIVVSSHHIGEAIGRAIVKELGGKMTSHPKLAGERDGKQLYRVTYAVRLPCYQRGDVIALDGRYYEIRDMGSNTMKVFDLIEGSMKVLREDCSRRPIGNVRDAENALVAYIDGDVAGILDPVTYVTRECKIRPWLRIAEGASIRLLRDPEEDKLVLVG